MQQLSATIAPWLWGEHPLKEISARIFEDEREKAGRMMAEASSEIQQVLRAALAEMVAHLRDRLADQTDGLAV